jgi:hypothetical protein
MKRIFLCLIFMLNTNLALAQNEVAMSGVGTMSCQRFVEMTKDANGTSKEINTLVFTAWTQGYLSGKNRQLNEMGYKFVDIGSVVEWGALLTFACGNIAKAVNSEITLYTIIDKIFEEKFSKVEKR